MCKISLHLLAFRLIFNQNLKIMIKNLNFNVEFDSEFKQFILLLYSYSDASKDNDSIQYFIEQCIVNVAHYEYGKQLQDFLYYREKTKNGFVYLMQDHSGLYKIGYSQNPNERLSQLKVGNPTINMYANYPANRLDEILLHRLFKKCKRSGEWFNLKPKHLKWIDTYFFNQNQ